MRKVRIVSQCVFLALFFGLLYFVNNQVRGYSWDSEFLLRFNPFSALLTLIASHSIILSFVITAGIITVLSLLLGRIFCGFFCPLGTLIDAADAWFFKSIRSKDRVVPRYFQRFKYVFMIALVVLSVFGGIFTIYFDPLSFLTRVITIVIDPILKVAGSDLNRGLGAVAPTASTLLYTKFPIVVRMFYGTAATAVLLLMVFGGGFWDKRFWCQYICPSGAFFGLLSRLAVFKRSVEASKCIGCRRCVSACPVHAIDKQHVMRTNSAECIACGVCVEVREGCSAFSFGKPAPASCTGPDIKRRHIVAGAAGGLLMVPMFRANAVSKRDDSGRLIRPPGAITENSFLAKCIACGACMKACPTNILQPCMFSDGFNRLYTPKAVARIAGCEEKCHLCGHVCPTGAIRKLPYEEKRFVKMGTAVIDRNKCLAWEQNKECLVCDEVCPYNAITAYVVETTTGKFKVPVVDEELCVGCGMCEQHCPVFDSAAIVIFRFGETRRDSGPYASDEQKRYITEKRKVSDSKHLGAKEESSGDEPSSSSGSGSSGFSDGFSSDGFTDEAANKAESGLPPGFSE